jgi:membrane protein DedA with SNARE-associated domain
MLAFLGFVSWLAIIMLEAMSLLKWQSGQISLELTLIILGLLTLGVRLWLTFRISDRKPQHKLEQLNHTKPE